jgi:hypothetical protein
MPMLNSLSTHVNMSPSSDFTYNSPASFAAAASMPPASSLRRRSRRASDVDASKEPPALRPIALSSMVQLRASNNNNKRKNKKWMPLNLSHLEPEENEEGNNFGDSQDFGSVPASPSHAQVGPSSYAEAASPERPPNPTPIYRQSTSSFVSIEADSAPREDDHKLGKLLSLFDTSRGEQRTEPYVDHDPTPTQLSVAKFPPPLLTNPQVTHYETGAEDLTHPEDTESTKEKVYDIMSRMDDAFDVEEWDPDLPSANENNSPEQLIVNLEPVSKLSLHYGRNELLKKKIDYVFPFKCCY